MVKVCAVAPAGIMTEAGTIACGELLVSATSAPPAGAGLGSDSTPVAGRPPGTEAAPMDSASWPMMSGAVRTTPAQVAVIVAAPAVADPPTSIANVWSVLPGGTTTVVGTVASGLLLASATVRPPAGAAAVSVIVPWTGTPAIATPVERYTLCSAGAVTTVVV